MKIVLNIVLGCVVFLSSYAPALAKDKQADSVKTRAIVVAVFEAFNRHDTESIVALYHPNAMMVTPSYKKPRYGLDVVREEYQGHFDHIPGVHDEVTRIVVEGNQAAVEFTASWDQPTEDNPDARGELHLAAFIKIEDGKIIEDITYFDRKAFESGESD